MSSFFPRRLLFPLSIIAIVYIALLVSFRWSEGQWQRTVDSDGKGYYAYLKNTFLDQNFGSEPYDADYHVRSANGAQLDKYTCGTALLQAPFFAVACVWAKTGGYSMDGFSMPFMVMVSLAGLFYFLAGLFLLGKIMLRWKAAGWQVAVVLFATAFGTSLLHYTVMNASLSHVYSFFLVVLFIHALDFLKDDFSSRRWTILALVFALVVLVRPVNGLVILLAPAFGGGKLFFTELFVLLRRPLQLAKPLLVFSALLSVQLFFWHLQTGHWFQWSYKGEGFVFTDPKLASFFISARKGLFIYYPLFLVSLAGLWIWFAEKRSRFYWTFLFLLSASWVAASWWCWDYGESFGMRPFTDLTGLFMLLLFGALQFKSKWVRGVVLAATLIASVLTLIFTYQFRRGILAQTAMTREKLAYIFMHTGDDYSNVLGGTDDLPPYSENKLFPVSTCTKTFATDSAGLLSCAGKEYPVECVFNVDEKMASAPAFYARIRFSKLIRKPDAAKDAKLAVQIIHADGSSGYFFAIRFKQLPQERVNELKSEEQALTTITPLQRGDIIKLFILNGSKEEFYISRFEVQLFYPE